MLTVAEIKEKWVKAIQETPLHRSGGYVGQNDWDKFVSKQRPDLDCCSCAMGKLYVIFRKDCSNIADNTIMGSVSANVVISALIFDVINNLQDPANSSFYASIKSNWSRIVHINDGPGTDEEVKARLVAYIQENF